MTDYLLYVPACFAVNMAFGPNNLLAINNAVQKGIFFAWIASFGRIAAFATMIALSAFGLGVVLSTSPILFTTLKMLGAAYLAWIGYSVYRSASSMRDAKITTQDIPMSKAITREAMTALSNPKAILVFAAFIPSFVDTDNYAISYAILGAIFLTFELVAIAIYAAIGSYTARSAKLQLHWMQRISGIGMMTFGGLMLFA
jgi:threonine/homoserine/homoserine lactone efflux protein